MHERLMRARYDKIVSGVCGGLAAYFELDPIIVRIVMLLLMMVGVGFILYPVLWVLMPIEPHHPPQQLGGSGWVPPIQYDPRVQTHQPDPVRQQGSGPFRYDPYTGQPIASQPDAYTGPTVQHQANTPQVDPTFTPPQVDPTFTPQQPYHVPPSRHWNRRVVLGVLLVAVGVFAVAEQLHLDDFVMPLVLIGIGAFMLLRQKHQ